MDQVEPPDPFHHDGKELSPEEAEGQISEFIAAADTGPGPSTAELVEGVLDHIRAAWAQIDAITTAQTNNKVIAMMLSASRRARELEPDDPEHWIAHAAATVLSGQIPAGSTRAD